MEHREWKGMSDHGTERKDVSMKEKKSLNSQPRNLKRRRFGVVNAKDRSWNVSVVVLFL